MTYSPSPSPARTHPIGCCSGFVVLAGIAVCLWLTMTLLPVPMALGYAEQAFQVVK